jgi:hypothetical protein
MVDPAYTGRCACGAVTLEITAKPVGVRQCWCRQCQQIAAGGPTNNAFLPTEHVSISGKLGHHAYVAPSGNTLTQWFCPSCGSPVSSQSSGRMHLKTVRLGVIDLPHDLKPEMAIWTAEAPAWALIDPALERYDGQPPAPPPVS